MWDDARNDGVDLDESFMDLRSTWICNYTLHLAQRPKPLANVGEAENLRTDRAKVPMKS